MIDRDEERLSALSPCPICGKEDMLYFMKRELAERNWSVGCGRCQIDTYGQRNRRDATVHWNGLMRSGEVVGWHEEILATPIMQAIRGMGKESGG